MNINEVFVYLIMSVKKIDTEMYMTLIETKYPLIPKMCPYSCI